MKILFISYDFPYPPAGGSISRDYNLIKQLSKSNEMYWINRTIRGKVKEEYKYEMKKYFKEMKIFEMDFGHNALAFLESMIKKEPYILKRFSSEEMKSAVKEITDRIPFDLILCDHIYLAQLIPDEVTGRIPVIPNNEDCGFTYYKRMSEKSGWLRRFYAGMEWKSMLKYEVGILKKYNVYITTSEKEKQLLTEHYKKANVFVLDNGVDTDYFFPNGSDKNSSPSLVFTAWFGYHPNADAAVYFVNKIFPLIKREVPDVKFYIVGKEPPEKVTNLENTEGVIVTGYVDDVRKYISSADVTVIPLRMGGGTRIKILESMAMKVPVVSTVIGAEGLNVEDSKNIMIADNEMEFAGKVIELIKDKEKAGIIAENGKKLIDEKYDWKILGRKMNEFLTEFVKNGVHEREN